MSPRAACRLEQLGFAEVYDYVPGKADWIAAGLPREGESAHHPTYAGDIAVRDVPTCRRSDPLADTLARMRASQQGFCVVAGDDGLVLGMLYADETRRHRDADTVEQAMRGGPTTVRASEPVEPLLERMRRAGVDGILVTDPEGRLLGLLDGAHAEDILATAQA